MSSAFVKESEEQWLHEIAPTMASLVNYLTRENNNIHIYEKKVTTDPVTGNEIHHMSNGLPYVKDADNRWRVA